MTVFWIVAAALVIVTVALLLRPLLRAATRLAAPEVGASNVQILRDQLAELEAERAAGTLAADQADTARAELERRVLEEAAAAEPVSAAGTRAGATATGLALAVPALAIGLYVMLGNQEGLDPILSKPAQQATVQDVETLVERLAQRMRDQPGDPEGWALLGRAYASMQRFELARDAFAQAVSRRPGDAQLLADYADSLAMTQGRSLVGEPERLVQLALQADPANLKALALAGSAAMERRDYKAAIALWTQARQVAPEGSEFAAGLDQSLDDARAAAGGRLPAAPTSPTAAVSVAVNGQVRIAPALASRVQPGDTLFVFARAAEGPRMPLAIQRGGVGSFPVAFTLDDSMAMTPELKLSAFDRVVIGARISRSGNATPQPGDLEGQSAPLQPGSGPVDVVIDQVRP